MEKQKHRISNWPEYNDGLKAKGDLGLWIDENTLAQWKLPKIPGKRGRPKEYSDVAIKCILTIRLVLNLTLRATEGFLTFLFNMAGIKESVPDYTLICKRQKHLDIPKLAAKKNSEKIVTDVVIDSTGIKVYGEGEWKVRTHGVGKRRTWRKLHLAIDPQTGEIIAEELTENDQGDSEELPGLLDQVEKPVGQVIADGAYDAKTCYEAIEKKRRASNYSSTEKCMLMA